MLVSACASVSVKEVARIGPPPPARVPAVIYVAPFTFTQNEIRVDRKGANLDRLQKDLQEKMASHLVRRLPKKLAPAKAVEATAHMPQGKSWLIRGNFDRVHQGSRLLRSVVGLGIGATRMDTTVVVYDLSGHRPKPFLRIVTTGGSNISPGVLGVATIFFSGPTALASLANAVDGLRSGISFDTVRTTREITAALTQYLYQRGAIPYKKASAPKRLGKFPTRIGLPDRKEMRGNLVVIPQPPDRP